MLVHHDTNSVVALGVLLVVGLVNSVVALTHPRKKGQPLGGWRIGALLVVVAAFAYWAFATFT